MSENHSFGTENIFEKLEEFYEKLGKNFGETSKKRLGNFEEEFKKISRHYSETLRRHWRNFEECFENNFP